MLFQDNPSRIQEEGTFQFLRGLGAVYTVGRGHVRQALADMLTRGTVVACDIETYGLGELGRHVKSVAFSDTFHSVVLDPRDPYQADLVRRTFEQATKIIFHNSPFDVPNLYVNGLIRLEDVRKVWDTLIYARMAHPSEIVPKNLEAASNRYLGTTGGGEVVKAFRALGLTKKDGYYSFDLDRPMFLLGAASDPLITWRLLPIVRQAAYDTLTVNNPFTKYMVKGDEAWALVDREQKINQRMTLPRSCKGLRVDFEYLDQYRADNAKMRARAERELEAEGIRPGVSADVIKVLEARGDLLPTHPRTAPTKRFPTGQLKGDAKTLEKMGHPIVTTFLEHKSTEKVEKDYLQKSVDMSLEGRIHPTVNLLAAVTGRRSMGDPPLHQFNGPARGIILPDEQDDFTSVDLSQGEPITLANAAHDWDVVRAYESGTSDVYTALAVGAGFLPAGTTTADCEYPEFGGKPGYKKIRGEFKVALLAQMFGEGLEKLSVSLGLPFDPFTPPSDWEIDVRGFDPGLMYPRFAEAKKIRTAVYSALPGAFGEGGLVGKLKMAGTKYRKVITISGRVLPIPFGKFGLELHKCINYFCQGGQYDLLADAEIRIIDAGLEEAVYLTMHDEFLTSTSAAHDIRKIIMEPNERLTFWAGGRKPLLRTDMAHLGGRWAKA